MSGDSGDSRGWRQRNESALLVAAGPRWRIPLVAGATALVVGALFWQLAGVAGALAGLAAVGIWAVLGAPYGIAAATVLATGLAPDAGPWLLAALVGTAGLVMLLAPMLATPGAEPVVPGVALVGAGLVTLAWQLGVVAPLWLAATGVLVTLALAAYALYRYHLLALGILDETAPSAEPGSAGAEETADQTAATTES